MKKQTNETVNRLMYESSSVFALLWNILQNQLPSEVNDDFKMWLQESQIVRMDTKGSQDSTQGVYTVKYGANEFVFHGVDMPPPSGVFATNYSRCVRDTLLGFCLYPINPGRFSNQYRTGADRCTPTLPR